MSKTAMQDLREDLLESILKVNSRLDFLDNITDENVRNLCKTMVDTTLKGIVKRIDDELLDMEREQIEQAYIQGCWDEIDERMESRVEESCKIYYNETGREFRGKHSRSAESFTLGFKIVESKMVEDGAAPIDWLINQLENNIVLSAHGKLGTNRTGDYRIGLRKAIDFCHQAKEMESKETLYTEEQVRDAIDMARSQSGYASYEFKENEIIQSLKQPKQ